MKQKNQVKGTEENLKIGQEPLINDFHNEYVICNVRIPLRNLQPLDIHEEADSRRESWSSCTYIYVYMEAGKRKRQRIQDSRTASGLSLQCQSQTESKVNNEKKWIIVNFLRIPTIIQQQAKLCKAISRHRTRYRCPYGKLQSSPFHPPSGFSQAPCMHPCRDG